MTAPTEPYKNNTQGLPAVRQSSIAQSDWLLEALGLTFHWLTCKQVWLLIQHACSAPGDPDRHPFHYFKQNYGHLNAAYSVKYSTIKKTPL